RVDGLRDRVAAEHAGLSGRIDDLKDHLSERYDAQTTRLDGLSTQVGGLTTRVDGLATSAARIEGWLERDGMERRVPESAP
ncbi:MAG: hypothetical protein OXQ28_04235, partial [Acidobacteriota bacterium]|nr:hypothetical protein [Acidobacteriota bacterium]